MYDTLKSLNICGICGSSPRHKNDVAPFLFLPVWLYVEFIGWEKARAYLQCIYCKVKQGIQRELSHTIKSRYACVWMYGRYMVANLILLCSLKTYLSFKTWKQFCKRTWAILFISFFYFFQEGI